MAASAGDNIRVVVRVRPVMPKEQQSGEQIVVRMSGQTTTLDLSPTPKSFTFDASYNSMDPNSGTFADQEKVFEDAGKPIMDNAFNGYNGCMFAYGQTGSGKSYSMMGYGTEPGIIPRLTEALFHAKETDAKAETRVWVSYSEIYNETIRDLLHVSEHTEELKVVEHPHLGVYVPNLTEAAVSNVQDVQKLMDFGTKKRVTAATNMNNTSSRSHAVMQIKIQKVDKPPPGAKKGEGGRSTTARVNLVDLAGSERVMKSQTEGQRLKEGCAINESLSVLGMVIRELAENLKKRTKAGHADYVQFRSSKLTFMLKDSLAGNSKTVMVAAIGPCASNQDETLSTLRFASTVKQIRTKPKMNHDNKEAVVAALQDELTKLRAQLESGGGHPDLHGEVAERERMLGKMHMSHSQDLAESDKMMSAREEAMKKQGLSSDDIDAVFGMDKEIPYLLNISDDPLLSGCLIYFLKAGEETTLGSAEGNTIQLKGLGISEQLCTFTNDGNRSITIVKTDQTGEGRVVVNGQALGDDAVELKDRAWLMVGRAHAMKIVVPSQMQYHDDHYEDEKDFEDMQAELIPEDSDAYNELRYYVEEMANKMDQSRIHDFFAVLRDACPLVDEANEITRHMLAHQNLKFEVEFVWDIYNCVPEEILLVRVLQFESATESRVLYYWPLPKFKERLELMRDAYHQFQASGTFAGADEPLDDPWNEADYAHLKKRLVHCEHLEKAKTAEALAVVANVEAHPELSSGALTQIALSAKPIAAPAPKDASEEKRPAAVATPKSKAAAKTTAGAKARAKAPAAKAAAAAKERAVRDPPAAVANGAKKAPATGGQAAGSGLNPLRRPSKEQEEEAPDWKARYEAQKQIGRLKEEKATRTEEVRWLLETAEELRKQLREKDRVNAALSEKAHAPAMPSAMPSPTPVQQHLQPMQPMQPLQPLRADPMGVTMPISARAGAAALAVTSPMLGQRAPAEEFPGAGSAHFIDNLRVKGGYADYDEHFVRVQQPVGFPPMLAPPFAPPFAAAPFGAAMPPLGAPPGMPAVFAPLRPQSPPRVRAAPFPAYATPAAPPPRSPAVSGGATFTPASRPSPSSPPLVVRA